MKRLIIQKQIKIESRFKSLFISFFNLQVHLHTSIESRLPTVFLKRVDKLSVTLYPNRCGGGGKRAWSSVSSDNDVLNLLFETNIFQECPQKKFLRHLSNLRYCSPVTELSERKAFRELIVCILSSM